MDIKENIVRDNPNITSPIFQSSEEQLMLFQIPDTVPGIPPSKDAPSIMVKQEPGVSSVKQEPVEQNQVTIDSSCVSFMEFVDLMPENFNDGKVTRN